MDLGIAGKRVLVTGASQGIGRAIAVDFAREGCRVAVVARRAAILRELVEDMGGEQAGHSFCPIDLMSDGGPTRAVEQLTERDASFDVVVHNVGGTLGIRDHLSPVEEWLKVWRFNVGIAIEMNDLVVPAMQDQGWGRVIHISSDSAISVRASSPYCAAKAYLNAYVKALGRAVAPNGIVVSALMPGAVLAEGGHWDHVSRTDPAKMADFLRHHIALGRLGTAEEISPFVLFMASQQVTFAAAAVIPVDGGTM